MSQGEGEMTKPLNYMAIDKEGRFVSVISGTAHPRDIARNTGKWIRNGLSVERCDNEYVRQHLGDIVKAEKGEGVDE